MSKRRLLSDQAIYNRVKRHLLKQGRRSGSAGNCMYRSKNGLRCAIGCLITNKYYDPQMERMTVSCVAAYYPGALPSKNIGLLRSLQSVHDHCSPLRWKNKLAEVAQKYGLAA